MNSYLEISNLTKRFGQTAALTGVNLRVERGATLAVLGPNGAGKSTLFGCVLGLTLPTTGTVLVNGVPVGPTQRASFGYVAERVAVYWQRTVRENAILFARLKGHSPEAAITQLDRLGLAAVAARPTRQLSKGMLQRLGLAIGLCGQPELLVLDEPFNGLDPALLDIFQAVLVEEKKRGATLLISTHTISAVEPLATDVAILTDGRLAAISSVEQLRMAHPESDSLEWIYRQVARRSMTLEELAA